MKSFQDKVVLVTGASSGIGAAIAEQFTVEGAKVAIVGRNETKLNDVAKKCEELGRKPLIIAADVTKDADARRVISDTITKFGKLDVLVNNAGIIRYQSILSEDLMKDFDQIMATNLRSVVFLTNIAGPHLVKTKGNIVNISSIAALIVPINYASAYCASKAGLDHFSRCVALELAPKGVRVNTINPGPVKTDIISNATGVDKARQDVLWKNAEKMTALGRISTSDDIADLTLFLAGDKAKSITGSSFVADNGAALIGLTEVEQK